MANVILAEISAHSKWLDSALKLILPSDYFPKEVEEDAWKRTKGKLSKARKDQRKLEVRHLARKAKKTRFDPSVAKESIGDIQISKRLMEIRDRDGSESFVRRPGGAAGFGSVRSLPSALSHIKGHQVSRVTLLDKLHSQIERLQKKRKLDFCQQSTADSTHSKRRKKDNNLTASKKNIDRKTQAQTKAKTQTQTKKKAERKEVDLQLSTLDRNISSPNSTAKAGVTNNFSRLRQTEEQQKKLLTMSSEEQNDLKWKKMTEQATGTRHKDNLTLLKKSIKKKEKTKENSRAAWAERLKKQEQVRDAMQKQRRENIRSRILQKKKGRSASSIKKDKKNSKRIGFEGRKSPKFLKDS